MKCWESSDRCNDCPRDWPDNRCSEYLRDEKKEKRNVKTKRLMDNDVKSKK
mgnify:CR=1 FL=1